MPPAGSGPGMGRGKVAPDEEIDLDEVPTTPPESGAPSEAKARAQTARATARLDRLQERFYADHRHALLVVLQGMDASGKDGTIRKVFEGVNPQGVRVACFKQPTPEELAHDYLWRVHAALPGKGEIAIFNRSHYEDVLVVRVHKLVPKERLRDRFEQINDFERELVEEGTTILKFYLHISPEEQIRRLADRLKDPSKHWKFSATDLKERALWSKYRKAYEDVLRRTSTAAAPWFVVPSDAKWYRDWLVSREIVRTLEGLDLRRPGLSDEARAELAHEPWAERLLNRADRRDR